MHCPVSTLGDDLPTSPATPFLTRTNIQLLEIKVRGRSVLFSLFTHSFKSSISNLPTCQKLTPEQLLLLFKYAENNFIKKSTFSEN